MRYGINMGPCGENADPRTLARLARDAEAAGWDAFFMWDTMLLNGRITYPVADPWIAMAAIAATTERIKFGTMVTPVPRRRPWKVAREAAALDVLSNGRFILGVGIGDPPEQEFAWFGDEPDYKLRAQMLDEGLEILVGLWSGEAFAFEGEHYRLHEMTFRPTPVQQPRIPIWVGGWWPRKPPFRRAARWDGVHPGKLDGRLTTDEVREMVAYIVEHRTSAEPFDVAIPGATPGTDPAAGAAMVAAYEEAGANWWIEDCGPDSFGGNVQNWPFAAIEERIRQGPPRV